MMRVLWILFLLAGANANTEYLTAFLDNLNSSNNSCDFTIKGRKYEIDGMKPCNLLYTAFQLPTRVSLEITDGKHISVGFSDDNHLARWRSRILERESFHYQMEGIVRNVFIEYKDYELCYIAVDTGNKKIRNNNEYQITRDPNICNTAMLAFYANQTIKMIGSVELRRNIPNTIIDFKYSHCSEQLPPAIANKES
ncbi:uncharacterized protein LOC123310560 [Coccinella septempunctata]|uniref:uncharacterized protein LOC123310560 n=1 Tax=Coccinella septempunctata TaxID=41139 RepID=UPI001D065DE8|nr:uncharacterized protein LOC123310560 [Coccinella septempunctata]